MIFCEVNTEAKMHDVYKDRGPNPMCEQIVLEFGNKAEVFIPKIEQHHAG